MMTRIGGFCAQHGAHLHRRGVGAQQHARAVRLRVEEERVVHVARRMVFREIELGEVVVVGLDVRPFGDGEAHVGEDRGQFVGHLGDRMDAADLGRRLAHRQRDVDALGVEPCFERRVLERFAARCERRVDAILQSVDQRPLDLALIGGIVPSVFSERRDASRSCRAPRPARLQARPRSLAAATSARISLLECAMFRCMVGCSFRHERQVGIARPAAGLGQHRMHLAAMVGLVIEHMGDQEPVRPRPVAFGGERVIGHVGGQP